MGKLVSSLELSIKFDERFKVTPVPYFIVDFILLSFELYYFTFKVLQQEHKFSYHLFENLDWNLFQYQLLEYKF